MKALVAVVLLGATVMAANAGAGTAASSVSFTAAQVTTGQKDFAQKCAMCHGANLEGGAGPALTGAPFKTLSSKVHATVSDIFSYMSTNMPMNAPASLSHDQYTAIMAFILSKNGYHPGGQALTFQRASKSSASIIAP